MKNPNSLDKLVLDAIKGLESFRLVALNDFDQSELKGIPKEILNSEHTSLVNYSNNIKAILTKLIDLYQELVISNPNVYIYRVKRKNSDKVYFNAKVIWLNNDGEKKEIGLYLGKTDEFNNSVDHPKLKELAVLKIKDYLREKKDQNII